MPPITLTQADITGLKTNKIFNNTDYTYLALWFDSDPNSMTQNIDADDFNTRWGIDNETLLNILGGFEAKKQIKIQPSPVTLTWLQQETTGMTQAEVLSMDADGLISTQTYVYYALLLSKGPGLTQVVNPDDFAVAPWKIDSTTLIAQINAIAAKMDSVTKKPIFTVDLSRVTITWLT